MMTKLEYKEAIQKVDHVPEPKETVYTYEEYQRVCEERADVAAEASQKSKRLPRNVVEHLSDNGDSIVQFINMIKTYYEVEGIGSDLEYKDVCRILERNMWIDRISTDGEELDFSCDEEEYYSGHGK